jgi:hypothetical protein
MSLKLGTFKQEAAECRARWEKYPLGTFSLHCHHEQLGELVTEPAENRISYILQRKPIHEQALRLHLFRPVSPELLKQYAPKAHADLQKAYADLQKAYAALQKAATHWRRMDAPRRKAEADWQKANADWQKMNSDLAEKVHTHLRKRLPVEW